MSEHLEETEVTILDQLMTSHPLNMCKIPGKISRAYSWLQINEWAQQDQKHHPADTQTHEK